MRLRNITVQAFLVALALGQLACAPMGASSDSSRAPSNWSTSSAAELGYRPQPGVMCVQRIATMVHREQNLCVVAKDGCEMAYLRSLGFVEDPNRVCSAGSITQ